MVNIDCPFKLYKNILGMPGKGAHKYRFLNTPIVDYVLTIVGAVITTYLTMIPLPLTTIVWFIMGIASHILFGVETETLKFLGVRCS